jgi:hypothetical protein
MAAYSPAFPPAVLKTQEKKIIDKNGIRTIGLRVERLVCTARNQLNLFA